jgi:hypothetical protein
LEMVAILRSEMGFGIVSTAQAAIADRNRSFVIAGAPCVRSRYLSRVNQSTFL